MLELRRGTCDFQQEETRKALCRRQLVLGRAIFLSLQKPIGSYSISILTMLRDQCFILTFVMSLCRSGTYTWYGGGMVHQKKHSIRSEKYSTTSNELSNCEDFCYLLCKVRKERSYNNTFMPLVLVFVEILILINRNS